MNANELPSWMPQYFVPSVYGGLLPAALSVEKSNANFRNGYLTTNEKTVERVVDRFQAAGQVAAAGGIRVLGQVAQDLLDLCIEAEPDEPFAWAVIEDAITALRGLLK